MEPAPPPRKIRVHVLLLMVALLVSMMDPWRLRAFAWTPTMHRHFLVSGTFHRFLCSTPRASSSKWRQPGGSLAVSHRSIHHSSPHTTTRRHHLVRWAHTPSVLENATSRQEESSLIIRLQVATMDEMEELGALLAVLSRPPDCFLLEGDLGAGKTCLARGFIQAKCADSTTRVTSPTYLLSNTYRFDEDDGTLEGSGSTREVRHMDLYRLAGKQRSEFHALDLPHVYKNCISLMEWPVRIRQVLEAEKQQSTGSEDEARDEDDGRELYPPASNRLDVCLSIQSSPVAPDSSREEDEEPRVVSLSVPHGSSWFDRINQVLDQGLIDDWLLSVE